MSNPHNILLVQLFSNGDCLYATAIARQIKHDYPKAKLFWLIASYCSAIIENNPYVDEVIIQEGINYKDWEVKWSDFKKNLSQIEENYRIDVTFFTQLIDRNFGNYDYCIRSSIFRGYGNLITVPIQPVLCLKETEIEKVHQYVTKNNFNRFTKVILFEFAPQSGQAAFNSATAFSIAKKITDKFSDVAVVLSSATSIVEELPGVFDGSVLSIRETAYLTNYCSLLVGCSSGITWASTSTTAKKLPMLQILDKNAYWFNSVVSDHKRFGLPYDHVLEISDGSEDYILSCLSMIISVGFLKAHKEYNEVMPLQFKVSRGLVFYMIRKGYFKELITHISINFRQFGYNWKFLKSIFLGIILFPITLIIKRIKELKSLS